MYVVNGKRLSEEVEGEEVETKGESRVCQQQTAGVINQCYTVR